MKLNLLLLGLIFSLNLSAQFAQLSEDAEVSLITVGPGPTLVDCFGHSALRVKDPALNLDKAYNYGIFDTTESGFYLRFAAGTQQYMVAAYEFIRFFDNYRSQNRWVTEQVLNINLEEKQAIFEFLENNILPQNRLYLYDQFFDNCATKLRDIPKSVLGDRLVFNDDHITEEATYRDLVDENSFNHPWMDLGIDIGLGNVVDRKADVEARMYLPDYVLSGYNHATIKRNGQEVPAIKATKQLFESDYYEQKQEKLSPTLLFSVIALIVIILTVKDWLTKKRSRWLDFTLFFITGLIGLIVLLLWVATHHTTTINNLNVLWAFAPNLIIAFFMLKKEPKKWLMVYARFLVILLIAMTFVWIGKLQVYNTALIPMMIMLTVRYVYLWQKGLGGTKKRAF